MAYYKRAKAACEAYNNHVVKQENYGPVTTSWSPVVENNGDYFIKKNERHPSSDPNLTEVLERTYSVEP